MSAPLLFFNEDVGAVLEFTITGTDGALFVATGVTMLVEGLGDFACSDNDASIGRWDYTVAADEFPAGRYRTQLRATVGTTVLHSQVFVLQVGEVVDFDGPEVAVIPPAGNPTEGAIPFGASGGGSYAEDSTNLLWDDTNNSLKLFGGTLGTAAGKVIALGLGTAPTTSPADTVQVFAQEIDGAGTGSLFIRPEAGGGLRIFDATYTLDFVLGAPVRAIVNEGFLFVIQGSNSFKIGTSHVGVDKNLGIGSPDPSFGDNADSVLAMIPGAAPTTAPADTVQIWAEDRNGAGTVAPFVRTEDSGINERMLAVTIQSFDGTERTCTNSATDLSSHTVNIPAGDAFIVTGLFRKSAGAAATVSLGLKINTVQVIANFAVSNADNEAQMGQFSYGTFETFGVGRQTDYTQGGSFRAGSEGSGTALAPFQSLTYAAQLPTAAITSIIVTGTTGNAATTLGVKNITVYRVSRS